MKESNSSTPDIVTAGSRRGFLKSLGGFGAGMAALPTLADAANAPSRQSGARYMGDFAAPKLDKVRCAFIGVGARGSGHCRQIGAIEGTEVVAICDLYDDKAKNAEKKSKEQGHSPKLYFGD